MCGVYRSGGSGYGGPASDEKFFDPEKVYTIHTYIAHIQDFIWNWEILRILSPGVI